MDASPVTAPAAVVVLNEEGQSNASGAYSSYPVATAVLDTKVRAQIPERTAMAAGFSTLTTGVNDTIPLSVQSEADLQSDLLLRRRTIAELDAQLVAASERNAMAATQPPPNQAEQDKLEDSAPLQQPRQSSDSSLSKNRQHGKLLRGVRKLGKLFKRRGRENNKETSVLTSSSQASLHREARNVSTDLSVDTVNPSQQLVAEPSGATFLFADLPAASGQDPTSTPDENPSKNHSPTRSASSKELPISKNKVRLLYGGDELDVSYAYSLEAGNCDPGSRDRRTLNLKDQARAFLLAGISEIPNTRTTGLEPPFMTQQGDMRRNPAAANAGGLDVLLSQNRLTSPPMIRPIPQTSPGSSSGGSTSVTASYVGTAEVVPTMQASNSLSLPDAPVAVESFVAEQADLKVDKTDTPDVNAMLRRACIEIMTDLEAFQDSDCLPSNPELAKYDGMSDGRSVPLSQALPHYPKVHNDTLKVVMVSASTVDKSWLARRLTCSTKQPRTRTALAVEVGEGRSYMPSDAASAHGESNRSPVKCMIWDIEGTSPTTGSTEESRPNFGAHPGTQSLFFSPQCLYLLCWDLGWNNAKTNWTHIFRDLDADDNEYDYYTWEEAQRQVDRALRADISNRVLSWVDCIARSGPKSAIIPVALIPSHMPVVEVKRRCDMMLIALEDHLHKTYGQEERAPKLRLNAENSILCVNNFGDGEGIQQLHEMAGAIANDPSHSLFDHVGSPVPFGTVLVRKAIQKFKEEHNLILLDHLLGELGNAVDVNVITDALRFLAKIGEIMYYGTGEDDVLARYIILSRKWLISALSCILRNDLKQELIETRQFMNTQCFYSDQMYNEHELVKTLVSGTLSSCPLLSDNDAKMLWQSMSFMREALDRYSSLLERSTPAPTMFYFLEQLLVRHGVFLPIDASLDQSEVYFVPSLLTQTDPTNFWTYGSDEGYMTTLCHSWLFRDGAPPDIMERVTVRILRDLYEFAKTFQSAPQIPSREAAHRVHSVPVGKNSFGEFIEKHSTDAFGNVRIHHVRCFKSSMLVKIGTTFADETTGDLRESFVEVFVAVVDQSSSHAVASDVMRPCMQRVVVSGKGQRGRCGYKLWKGGYKRVLDSVQETLADMPNVDSQVICPECLSTSNPRVASTMDWKDVRTAAKSGHAHVICPQGHRVNSNLICGTCPDRKTAPVVDPPSSRRFTHVLSIKEALPSVVLVGVWSPATKSIICVGSGFIVDEKAGLIVTAGHVLFAMGGDNFGKPYFGYKDARAVIGIIPDKESKHAVFRYFADIVAHDIRNVDACVLQVTARLANDVDDKVGVGSIAQPETAIRLKQMPGEELLSLKLTTQFSIAEPVHLLGYNQGGEGIFEEGSHISHAVEYVGGEISRHFRARMCDDSFNSVSNTGASNDHPQVFSPREEIIVRCRTIGGHSGGPCVNADGKVVGILSREDPANRERCYLVPVTEIRPLIKQAKSLCCSKPRTITSVQMIDVPRHSIPSLSLPKSDSPERKQGSPMATKPPATNTSVRGSPHSRTHILGLGALSPDGASVTAAAPDGGPRCKTVQAPPGKLGISLDFEEGAVVHSVFASSALAEKITPGDRIVAIDGEDVSLMSGGEISTIMARKKDFDRTLTLLPLPRHPDKSNNSSNMGSPD